MKQKTLGALAGASLFFLLGIVGAVENGAPLGWIAWTLIPLSVLAICANAWNLNRREK